MQEYQINGKRLIKNLFTVAQIGMNEKGGIDRVFGSQADYEAREWIKKYWQKVLELPVHIDAIANLWAERKGTEDKLLPLAVGSHHDAVPDGGKYDGIMGVLIATEIMQTIIEQKIILRHPLQIISFTGEEPNPFNISTLGSKVISGRLGKNDLETCQNRENGEYLSERIKYLGGNWENLDKARISQEKIAAFLEVHNELGGYLEKQNIAVSGVKIITGIYRESICVKGEANHAGTTMMEERKDAFLALGELAEAVEEAARSFERPDVVATMGYVKVSPNEANIIPGTAEAIIDIRTCDDAITQKILNLLTQAATKISEKRKVVIQRIPLLNQPARVLDKKITQVVQKELKKYEPKSISVVSMAGHDAANMQLITRAGMIFVRSVGGKGHCRQEYSKEEDIIEACQIALNVLRELDTELD